MKKDARVEELEEEKGSLAQDLCGAANELAGALERAFGGRSATARAYAQGLRSGVELYQKMEGCAELAKHTYEQSATKRIVDRLDGAPSPFRRSIGRRRPKKGPQP